jgi:phosphoglycolate phosphatase
MQKKLLVFDWDGTIVDSVPQIARCKRYLAKQYNLPEPDENTVKSVLGKDFKQALEICYPTASKMALNQLASDFHVLMRTKNYQSEIFPNVELILRQLRKRKGLFLAVATSKAVVEMESALKYTKLKGLFDMVCSGEDYESKPDPSMLYCLMDKFEATPQETLMIGDTTTDICFAQNAGVDVVAVDFGAHTKCMLSECNPTILVSSWNSLTRVFAKYGI